MKKLLLYLVTFFALTAHSAESVLVYNVTFDKHYFSKNINQTRPLASITKLMTAMVVLDYDKDLTRELMLSNKAGSKLPRQKYTRSVLLKAMLVKSDNAAAETLAEDYPGGRQAFIREMNRAAKRYEMNNTFFDDPSGLSAKNRSTAIDVSTLADISSGYWLIREISTQKQIAIDARYKKKVRSIILPNTNKPILFEFDNVVVSKTGFTNSAGWCVALVVEQGRQKYVVVVLGAPNKQRRTKTVEDIIYNHIIDFDNDI